ncbi:MAG: hypothetical protein DHS20C20_00440 [Ardenticatenaceae bacterium]|nr:MAG: hypothetical protein DHS20C20_00440 [Ardenticatenaceae bacterium]
MKPFLFGLLGATALLLGAAFFVADRQWGIPIVWVVCVLWGILLWPNGRFTPAWPAILLALTAALSLAPIGPDTPERPLIWSYLATILLLMLWDLTRFYQRLHDVAESNMARPLILSHLRRLGLLLLLSLIAIAMQQWLPLSFNFDLALVSGLLLIFGLNALLNRLRLEQT